MPGLIRRILLGHPLPTQRIEHEKLGKVTGLAVFASDGVSSVAYATEEILRALALAGTASLAMAYSVPVGMAIAVLIVIVVVSYRQTVMAYPSGGGAYTVARANLGVLPSQTAAAALMVDYVLTVAVSVSAGVAAITSAWPALYGYRVLLGVLCVATIAIANLRGLRESSRLFTGPTYLFILIAGAVIAVGGWRLLTHAGPAVQPPPFSSPAVHALNAFLVLKAFSSGCAALTGIEAISNGVPSFKAPAGPNARAVLGWLGLILASLFIGLTVLARHFHVGPQAEQTVLSQLGHAAFGRGGLYYVLQIATAIILILAANTSFAGFPHLASAQAQDGYMPRQLANIGDKLVYSNGIVLLGVLSAGLIFIFHGETHRLIPLYAIGVFTAFTISQAGMVQHWRRNRGPGWLTKMGVNAMGAFTTAVVLGVIAFEKFLPNLADPDIQAEAATPVGRITVLFQGAWIVIVIVPALILMFFAIRKHYDYVAERLRIDPDRLPSVHRPRNITLVPVAGVHRGVVYALEYARSLGAEVRGVHIEAEGLPEPRLKSKWDLWEKDVPLIVLQSPYRDLAGPLLDYIDKLRNDEGFDTVTVVLPEFVVPTWTGKLLHNHSALWLQLLLRNKPGVAVINFRYYLEEDEPALAEDRPASPEPRGETPGPQPLPDGTSSDG